MVAFFGVAGADDHEKPEAQRQFEVERKRRLGLSPHNRFRLPRLGRIADFLLSVECRCCRSDALAVSATIVPSAAAHSGLRVALSDPRSTSSCKPTVFGTCRLRVPHLAPGQV